MLLSRFFSFCILVFFIFDINIAIAESTNSPVKNYSAWFALSSLWGQGNMGFYSKRPYYFNSNYNFVFDWDDKSFSYNELSSSFKFKGQSLGLKYRNQLKTHEITPYVSYFYYKTDFILPFSLYNELELRFNSVVKSEDYFRSRHVATVYFLKEKDIRPYFAFDYFFDLNDLQTEKSRINLGYFMTIYNYNVRVYYIPYTYGYKEKEWDDQHSFGASLVFNF